MIGVQRVESRLQRRAFYNIAEKVYRDHPLHRSTEDDVMRMLVEERSVFLDHARIDSFLIKEDRRVVGRFSLIQDRRLSGVVQVAFFEALPGLVGVLDGIRLKARALYPDQETLVVGLNGHLNYGCGFLTSRFDQPPVFGLPYTPEYYLDYFAGLTPRKMVSYRFDSRWFFQLRQQLAPSFDPGPITIRTMNRKQFEREVDIYTWLNNECFQKHPFWADRSSAEDAELFKPFMVLMRDEHYIVAEHEGRPVGFLLWYPDFNELLSRDGELGVRDALRYHLKDPIQTARLTEIAVLPEYRSKRVDLAMILQMIRGVEQAGYRHTEGGFIFEENRGSIALTLRYIRRATGHKPKPYRRYSIFEGPLHHDSVKGAEFVSTTMRAAPGPKRRLRGQVAIQRLEVASSLDDGWDDLCSSAFQRREFLRYAEQHNPCKQRYYQLRQGGELAGGAMVYTIDLDLLTYSGLPSPVKMQIVGVPCSQSSPGLVGARGAQRQLAEHIIDHERGLLVGLNLEQPLGLPGVLDGRTLPAVILRHRFESWEHYLASLRSSYRRRMGRLERSWQGVVSRRGSCDRFDGQMYRQYLAVLNHSDARLEKLSHEFLRQLPAPFTLTTHRLDGRLVGWHIALSDGERFHFFMVGMDYRRHKHLNAHGNIVAAVLREAIADGASIIDLGQTAEVSKTRLGGVAEERYLFGYHRRRTVRTLLEHGRRFIEYRTRVPQTHVFRADP